MLLFQVSDDTVQADWRQTFADSVETYHYFEWAVGTGEGKSDILEFENVGMNGSVKMNGLDLGGLNSCFITLRAWKLDGRCTELSVKAHALKGQQCVHRRLSVGDGFVTITRGENIRRFFEHAEEAEEEEVVLFLAILSLWNFLFCKNFCMSIICSIFKCFLVSAMKMPVQSYISRT